MKPAIKTDPRESESKEAEPIVLRLRKGTVCMTWIAAASYPMIRLGSHITIGGM